MHLELLLSAVILSVGFHKGVSAYPQVYGFKALAGEKFVLQCASPHGPHLFNASESLERSVAWFRSAGGGTRVLATDGQGIVQCGNSLHLARAEEQHAGNYSCSDGKEELHFLLDVVPRNGKNCKDHGENKVTFTSGQGGRVYCPGVSCYTPVPAVVRWYKGNISTVLLVHRALKITGTELLLKTVLVSDGTVFTCDFNHTDGILWTVRRLVEVTVVPDEREVLPIILYPGKNCTEEMELGKPKILMCKVQFAFEKNFKPLIKWLVSYDNGSEEELAMDNWYTEHSSFGEETIVQSARLQQVTMRDLSASFICFAQNSRGNVTSMLRLTRRPEAFRHLEIIIAPVVALILVAGASVVVQLYRLEIFLLCRVYLPFQVSTTAGKEFDAFVSYAVHSSSEEVADLLTGEALGLCYLPKVLEQQWGYKLCLLERDLIPGGSYAEEVVKSIQSSQAVICLLSANYLAGPCLFELETALKTLLEETGLKVILVWISRPPAGLLHPPLPRTVKAALRILPALHWSSADSTCSESRFWKALRLIMPKTKVCSSSSSAE